MFSSSYSQSSINSNSSSKSDIRFILAARQSEYKNFIIQEKFGIDVKYKNALEISSKNPNFLMDVPPFTKEEVKEFIQKYHNYLPVSRKNKSLDQNTEQIYKDSQGGNPILVRFQVTGDGLTNDVENWYKNYLSFDKNGRQIPNYNRIMTLFVCSLYHISTLPVDDNVLKKMKIQTSEDGMLVEKNLYQFANELDGGLLYRTPSSSISSASTSSSFSSDSKEQQWQWKTLHARWA